MDKNNLEIIQHKLLNILQTSWISLLSDFFSHPFSTCWTMQQSFGAENKSFFQVFNLIRKNGGFYAGFSPQAFTSIPGTSFYLTGRQLSISIFGDNHVGQLMQGPFGVGFGMIIWAPASRLTMLQQAGTNSSVNNIFNRSSLFEKCRFIWKCDGILGFYRGIFPASAAFAINEAGGSWIQYQLLQYFKEKDYHPFIHQLLATFLAFSIISVLSLPLEVCAARLKIAETNPKYFPEKQLWPIIKKIYLTKGCVGFWRGLPAAMANSAVWRLNLVFAGYHQEKEQNFSKKNDTHFSP